MGVSVLVDNDKIDVEPNQGVEGLIGLKESRAGRLSGVDREGKKEDAKE
jgi:hypothetical protein